MVADISHSVKLASSWPRYPLISRQCRAWAAATFPRFDQSCLPPVPGPSPAAPSRHPLRRRREISDQPCPANPLSPRLPTPKPNPGKERHAALSGRDVRGVRDGAQPDGRGAQSRRRFLPHDAGRFLRSGGHVTHHPDQPLLPDERWEGSVGQREAQSQREREKVQFQSAGIHLGVLSRPRQRFTHQSWRTTCV